MRLERCSETEVKVVGSAKDHDLIRQILTVQDPNCYRSADFRDGYWDGYHRFHLEAGKRFPAGLLERVTERLEDEEIPYTLQDLSPNGQATPGVRPDLLRGITLRDYQLQAVERALEARRGVVKVPPRGGKTACQAAVDKLLGVPSVLLCGKKSLLRQHRRAFRAYGTRDVGRLGAGYRELDARVVIATVQTLWKGLEREEAAFEEFLATRQLLQIDECFPGRQHVLTSDGPATIGGVYRRWRAGERVVVASRDFEGNLRWQPVTYAWKRPIAGRELLRLRVGKLSFRCTPEHRFRVSGGGWRQARRISPGTLLSGVADLERAEWHVAPSLSEGQLQLVLGSFLGDGNVQAVRRGRYRLRVIHGQEQRLYCEWKARAFGVDPARIESNGYAGKPAYRFATRCFDLPEGTSFPAGAKISCPQWVLDALDARGVAVWLLDDGSFYPDRARGRHILISTDSFDGHSVGRMVEKLRTLGIEATVVQAKHGRSAVRITSKGYGAAEALLRRYAPPGVPRKAAAGSTDWAPPAATLGDDLVWGTGCVSSVEPISSRGDSALYDLEVRGDSNFVVCSSTSRAGVVAHNCHHTSADTYYAICQGCPAEYRIAWSGTPMRDHFGQGDFHAEDVWLQAATGPLIYDISSAYLRANGFLATPQITMIPIRLPKVRAKSFATAYKQGIVEHRKRNAAVVALGVNLAAAGFRTLLLVTRIRHGQDLLKEFNEHDVPAAMSVGNDKVGRIVRDHFRWEPYDKQVLRDFRRKEVPILIGSTIYDEGIDLPWLDALINAGGWRSPIVTLQRAYRAMTHHESKSEVLIFDFMDEQHYLLKDHSKARKRSYVLEEIPVQVAEHPYATLP